MKIPKNTGRMVLALIGALLVLAAVVVMFVGFVDAGTLSPDEAEGPEPPARTPGTLPR